MAKRDTARPVQLSVLDRLLDDDPKNSREAPLTRAQSVRMLKRSIARDIEWLLNTHRSIEEVRDSDLLLESSLFNYGLPDITSFNRRSSQDQKSLLRLLESAVSTFEPRLEGIRVIRQDGDEDRPRLRFTIEGMLLIEPSPELVAFDTFVEVGSGECTVKED